VKRTTAMLEVFGKYTLRRDQNEAIRADEFVVRRSRRRVFLPQCPASRRERPAQLSATDHLHFAYEGNPEHRCRADRSTHPGFFTGKPSAHAANARRTATDSICSAAGVNCEPITSPMRRNVMSATGSQNAVETPSANIAIVRCSSESRSVQEIPSTVHLGSSLPPNQDGTSSVKILLNSSGQWRIR
jgi:hypothetical protein